LCQHLQPFIEQVGGSDGIRMAVQAGRLVAEPAIVHKLGRWTQATSGDLLILWIMSPFEPGPKTSAQLSAFGVIWTAIRAEAQFISYICERVRPGRVAGFRDNEDKAGVLAMVYSLILQLLQFQIPGDGVSLRPEMIDQLTEPEERWASALNLLRYLLENTPTLRYCIISGISLLEGGAREMCKDFVSVLLAHVRNAEWPLRVLFTTSGQSRALSEAVCKQSKVSMNNTFYQMKGTTMYRDVQMPE
jgi:hypothetical protein